MNKLIHYTVHKAKSAICFCLVLFLNHTTAQDVGHYKYIIPIDTCYSTNYDLLEANNRYYYFSSITSPSIFPEYQFIVSVYDEDLNKVEEIQLPSVLEDYYFPLRWFYNDGYFYAFGYYVSGNQLYPPSNTVYFAKYNENFDLVQPVSFYTFDDTIEYTLTGASMAKNEEFIFIFRKGQFANLDVFLLHINKYGDILQDVSLSKPDGDGGYLIETDSNYWIFFYGWEFSFKFCKGSLDKYEVVEREWYYDDDYYYYPLGTTIAVEDQFIQSGKFGYIRKEGCLYAETDIAIVFFNKDLSVKNILKFGNPCVNDEEAYYIDYVNPDSIYCAYRTWRGESRNDDGFTISIANFSQAGQLNFNYKLELPEELPHRFIEGVKALSNGGVLVYGIASPSWIPTNYGTRGFLLYYHPTKGGVGVVETDNSPSLRVFPNPANGQLTISLPNPSKGGAYTAEDIEIYDVVGQNVLAPLIPLRGELEPSSNAGNFPLEGGLRGATIDISHLANGMYFLRVGGKTVKFVKE